MSFIFSLSASQAQDYSHDFDQQEHEDETTDDCQEGSTHQVFCGDTKLN